MALQYPDAIAPPKRERARRGGPKAEKAAIFGESPVEREKKAALRGGGTLWGFRTRGRNLTAGLQISEVIFIITEKTLSCWKRE